MSSPGKPALSEIADGVYAYLQQGGWGFSNAGLIASGGATLLVDTLYDLRLTEQMLAELRRAVPAAARIDTLVNTHANGDHCWGNQLVEAGRIVSSRAAAEEMLELSPQLMAMLVSAARLIARAPAPMRGALRLLGRLGVPRIGALTESADFVVDAFGAFEFGKISLTLPTETFSGSLQLQVGDTPVELIEVGPAHTKGDVLVYLPRQRVVFTGDILFMGSHPIMWEGPVANWVRACDRLLALDVDVIVPGHGPVATKDGVRETRAYWSELVEAVTKGRSQGARAEEIAIELYRSAHRGWSEASRMAVNVDTIYRELAQAAGQPDPVARVAQMARIEKR